MLREYLAAMQALWSQEEASYDGEFVRFGGSWAWPKPVQQPRIPIIVGAGGTEATFAWIARSADGWITTPGEADLDAKVAQLHETWRQAGRDGLPQVTVLAGKPDPARAPFDWRRQYGETVATFLRGYILDLGLTSGLFDVVSQPAAEKLLSPPHADRASVWALATVVCLVSGDYRKAREKTPQLPVT